MSRRFRFYRKKRGHRQSGSPWLGTLGEAVFFGALLAVGVAGLAAMLVNFIVPEWRANRQFLPTRCIVLGTEVREFSDPTPGAPLADDSPERPVSYQPLVHIRYEIEGRTFETKTYDVVGSDYRTREEAEALLAQFRPGDEFVCWYDPFDFERAVLVRGYSWWVYLLLVLPAAFILFGSGGLIFTALRSGTSAERRAALVKRAGEMEWFDPDELLQRGNYPAIPSHEDINNSPGTALAYRLPIGTQGGWRLFSLGMVTACWNLLVLLGLSFVIRGHITGARDWLLIALLVPCLLFGFFLIYSFFRQILVTGGLGMTRVEISDHPLHPGGSYELLVIQEGKLAIDSLVVLLVCEESATFRQGTDLRCETCRVHQQELFRRENFEIQPDRGFEGRADFSLPEQAMHSFATEHNGLRWLLLVRGDLAHWPSFERRFPLVVLPLVELPEPTREAT